MFALLVGLMTLAAPTQPATPAIAAPAIEAATRRLIELHGEDQAERARRGVAQVAERWWPEDGDEEAFRRFCETQFITAPQALDRTFERLEFVLEQVDGHLHEVRRELLRPLELDTGAVGAADQLLGGVDLAAHVNEDLFRTKVAFLALLNFPVHTLQQRLAQGAGWSRDVWARSRMMDRFNLRVPAGIQQEFTRALTQADQYIADYNIRMDRLLTRQGQRPFPEGLRLITHWGLRDELKSHYAEADGLERQRMILRVMERIVRQEIPRAVIDNAELLWCPETNEVFQRDASGGRGAAVDSAREPDVRYEHLLDVFRAAAQTDRYSPTAPTYIARRFDLDREIPETEVEALLVAVLTSPEFKDTAAVVRQRLGRPLEAFDIWYAGFKPRGSYSEAELDKLVAARYPTVESFQSQLPRVLGGLGFTEPRAAWISEHIVVDPSRGAGHAMGAVRREDKAHLRTRIGAKGMDYKGYNIAIHELGHNVEQVFSLNAIDHWWLNGVPNTAFTEALAFVFQNRDLELLLGKAPQADEGRRMEALDTLWATAEIGGVALVDMQLWRWMYAHPEATASELRLAALDIARTVWNRYYAPVFGVRDQEILAIYSHMITYGLYLPDYPLGHIIAFQVAERFRSGDFGAEFERVARQGRLTPDLWMRGAVGQPLSSRALLAAAREALGASKKN
ncbi:MAG TPA: hypothetical protein VJS92_12935 [Candidatus Polarisedimenticolaceae bacterium]|nr:hypothetical protein [Candidatus Polarisedimenticolaceae bacterium]